MAYIANRPVRFDRDYAIGEIIPDGVIDPKMTTKLIGMGRIIRIPDADVQETATDGAESPADSDNGDGGINTSEDTENAQEDEPDAPEDTQETAEEGKDTDVPATEEFICEVCGKTFESQQGLAAHSRSHKK